MAGRGISPSLASRSVASQVSSPAAAAWCRCRRTPKWPNAAAGLAACVLWATPVDEAVGNFRFVVLACGGAAAFLWLLFVAELARGRLALPRRTGWALALLAPVLALAAWAVVWSVGGRHPAWELFLTQAAVLDGPAQGAARAVASVASLPVLLAALLALAAWPAIRGRWPETYVVLGAGFGLALAVIALKLILPREPPDAQPFFAGATAFPNETAALGLAVLGLHGWLRLRLLGRKPRWAWRYLAALGLALAPVLAGVAWPADAVAGLLLGAAWLATTALAWHLWLSLASPSSLLSRWTALADGVAHRIVLRPEPWLAGVLGLGIALRILVHLWQSPAVDAYSYAAMAHSFRTTGAFTMPWGDVDTFHTDPVPSNHYPPLYPMYLAGFYTLFGTTLAATDAASTVASLAALAVAYACTRDLYGPRKALVAAAALAASPLLVQGTAQDYSENLVLLFFTATLWAILRSLERPWFILPAGVLAGLGYLTKSTMGPFFVVAGLGGLAWRLHWKGWKVLRDPPYLAAIAAFALIAGAWMLRNLRLFGSWETSFHIRDAVGAAVADPWAWLPLFLVTLAFYATAGYLLWLALIPWLATLARIPKLASEHDSGLWLALGLPLVLSAAIDACLWLIEGEFFLNNARYIAFVAIPALWLLLRHADLRKRSVRLATVASFVLLVASSLYLAKPAEVPEPALAADLAPRLADGESVAFVDHNNHYVYRYYFALTQDGARAVDIRIACVQHPLCPPDVPRASDLATDWIVAPNHAASALPAGYTQVHDAPWDGGETLWRRTA